jgi:hypothetical protein
MKKQYPILTCAALAVALGCSDSTPAQAPSLSYTDPPQHNGFRFLKNSTLSTPTHLVLDLVATGQVSTATSIAFSVSHSGSNRVQWTKVADSDLTFVRNGEVFSLGTGIPGVAATASATQIKAVVGQKGITSPKNLNSGVLASIALDSVPGASSGTVTFSADKLQIVPGARTVTTVASSSVSFGALRVE